MCNQRKKTMNKYVGEVNLAYWMWHGSPATVESHKRKLNSHALVNVENEIVLFWPIVCGVCVCVYTVHVLDTVCVCLAKAHKIHYCNNLSRPYHSFIRKAFARERNVIFTFTIHSLFAWYARFRFSFSRFPTNRPTNHLYHCNVVVKISRLMSFCIARAELMLIWFCIQYSVFFFFTKLCCSPKTHADNIYIAGTLLYSPRTFIGIF